MPESSTKNCSSLAPLGGGTFFCQSRSTGLNILWTLDRNGTVSRAFAMPGCPYQEIKAASPLSCFVILSAVYAMHAGIGAMTAKMLPVQSSGMEC
jgi:hypothetical protein